MMMKGLLLTPAILELTGHGQPLQAACACKEYLFSIG